MDFLIDMLLDFFVIYKRDSKKAGRGWLYKLLLFANIVAAVLIGQAEGILGAVFPWFFGAVAVVLLIKLIRHENKCMDEWAGGEPQ